MLITLTIEYNDLNVSFIDELLADGEYIHNAINYSLNDVVSNCLHSNIGMSEDPPGYSIVDTYKKNPKSSHPGRKVFPKEMITYLFVIDIYDFGDNNVLDLLDGFPGKVEAGNTLKEIKSAA